MASSTTSSTGTGSPSARHSRSVRASRPDSPQRNPGSLASACTITERTCPRDRLEVALLFGADPVVIGVLAPARPALVAVEALAAGAIGAEAGQLQGIVGRDLEEAGPHPVENDRE